MSNDPKFDLPEMPGNAQQTYKCKVPGLGSRCLNATIVSPSLSTFVSVLENLTRSIVNDGKCGQEKRTIYLMSIHLSGGY